MDPFTSASKPQWLVVVVQTRAEERAAMAREIASRLYAGQKAKQGGLF